MTITATQIADMTAHIHACDACGDEEIRAELGELPAEELAETIASAHDPRWQAILTGNAAGAQADR